MWGLAIKLLIVTGMAATIYVMHLKLDAADANLAAANQRVAVDNGSIKTLENAVAVQDGAVKLLAADSASRTKAAENGLAAVAGRDAAVKATSDALRATSTLLRTPSAPCTVDAAAVRSY